MILLVLILLSPLTIYIYIALTPHPSALTIKPSEMALPFPIQPPAKCLLADASNKSAMRCSWNGLIIFWGRIFIGL